MLNFFSTFYTLVLGVLIQLMYLFTPFYRISKLPLLYGITIVSCLTTIKANLSKHSNKNKDKKVGPTSPYTKRCAGLSFLWRRIPRRTVDCVCASAVYGTFLPHSSITFKLGIRFHLQNYIDQFLSRFAKFI